MLWSLSETHLSKLSTGSTQEDCPYITERLLMGRKESNQTNKNWNNNRKHCYTTVIPETFSMGWGARS